MKRKTTQALLAIGAIVLGLLVIGAVAAVAAPKPVKPTILERHAHSKDLGLGRRCHHAYRPDLGGLDLFGEDPSKPRAQGDDTQSVVLCQGQVRSEAPGGEYRGQAHGHPRPGGHDSRPGQRHQGRLRGPLAPPAPPPAPVSTTTTTAAPTNGAGGFIIAPSTPGAVVLHPTCTALTQTAYTESCAYSVTVPVSATAGGVLSFATTQIPNDPGVPTGDASHQRVHPQRQRRRQGRHMCRHLPQRWHLLHRDPVRRWPEREQCLKHRAASGPSVRASALMHYA